jgi:hypothetical protein
VPTVTAGEVPKRVIPSFEKRRSSYVPAVLGMVKEHEPDVSTVLPAVFEQLST